MWCIPCLPTLTSLNATANNVTTSWLTHVNGYDIGWAVPFPSQSQLLLIVLLVSMLAMALAELFGEGGAAIAGITSTVTGVIYVSLFFGTFIGLREIFVQGDFPAYRWFPEAAAGGSEALWAGVYRWGGYTVISVLSTIWICDTAAYHTGKAMGKHTLFARVSPNKTWEGAIAGFVFAILSAVAAKYLVLDYLTLSQAVVIGLIVGTLGQVGDLFESLLKRDAGGDRRPRMRVEDQAHRVGLAPDR